MITIVATLRAKAEYREMVLTTLQELVKESLQEVGCKEYRLHISANNPLEFLFYETWESKEAIDAHTQTAHFLDFQQKATEWLEQSEINLYQEL
ncbi:antibiotic biosynthesis monooxygenase [Flavobacterium supellecticarium]|uniref:Antibiotic biosynthesis monooxygenase n=1 Tax=Flavobacterium supellecticarium TaxID=2565924 RepID=A0A4S3ZWC5_9FLAO|nr:putative quinol monooxygenase [Flavobacterium supellecticarium]THF49949.1 antibiotic biosynthesis monooxygenase [Flavobacterium supellecticarium]